MTVELCDYRALADTGRTYDAVLSVEMIEAVGHEFWGTYFRTIDRGARPRRPGRASRRSRCRTTGCSPPADGHTWINKYIFPGGFLPSVEVIDEVTREQTDAPAAPASSRWAATTPRRCAAGTAASSPQRDAVLDLGFDDIFMRVWHFYLAYSQAGFASGYINVSQLTFTRETP